MSSSNPSTPVRFTAQLVDITTLRVDAIVNAANEQLLPGGGVCGAIHRAAGPELAAACAKIGGCGTGHAVMTEGCLLPARYVIHAVGPVWRDGGVYDQAMLASAYAESLGKAMALGLESIAFPAISTGIYGYPLRDATRIAVETCRRVAGGSLREVIFACFSEEAVAEYREAGVEVVTPGR